MSAGGRPALRALGLVVGVVLSAVPAPARADDGPIAIAVDSRGASYVGFAEGGRVAVLDVDGDPQRSLRVPGDRPVTGLAVDAGDQVWVDDGETVSLLDRRGRLVRTFAHRPLLDCPAADGDARRFGDVALGPGAVYVADRCRGTLAAYSRTGLLRALVPLPNGDRAGGLAWVPGGYGRPPRLLVTIPTRGRLLVYDADRLADTSRPLEVRKAPRIGGGRRPEPSGIVADRFGQVVLADAANHVLMTLDGFNDFRRYRTRGYPGRPGSRVGALRAPAALAQHRQDGSGLAGDLWVADTGNERVQRMDPFTWTWWAQRVRRPAGPGLTDPAAPCEGPVEARVNAGERWTRTPQVVVRVVPPPGATGLVLGSGATDGPEVGLRGDCTYDWRLAPGDTEVRARVVGGPSDGEVLVDRIGLDTRAPRVRSASARWVRAERRWELVVDVVDPGAGASGATTVLHSNRRNGSALTVGVRRDRAVLHTRDGRTLGWVRAVDRAGNAGDWVRVDR